MPSDQDTPLPKESTNQRASRLDGSCGLVRGQIIM